MEKNIEELTLLLIYLTSWDENEEIKETSFKYNFKDAYFKALKELTDKKYLMIMEDKKIILTKKGRDWAEELALKYLNK